MRSGVPTTPAVSIKNFSLQYSCGNPIKLIQIWACVLCWVYKLKSFVHCERWKTPDFKLTVPWAQTRRKFFTAENLNSQNPRPRVTIFHVLGVFQIFDSFNDKSFTVYGFSPLLITRRACKCLEQSTRPFAYLSSVIGIDITSPLITENWR